MSNTFDASNSATAYSGNVGSSVPDEQSIYTPAHVPTPSFPNSGIFKAWNFGESEDLSSWVKFNDGGKVSAAIENGCLILTKDGDVGTVGRGFGTTGLPSGDFTVVCEVSFQRHRSNNDGQNFLFVLFEDVGNISKKCAGIAGYLTLGVGQAFTITSDGFENSTTKMTVSAAQNVSLGNGDTSQILRVKKTGTNYKFLCSKTGREWQLIFDGTLPFTPTGYGFIAESTAEIKIITPWIYVYGSESPSQIFGKTIKLRAES